MRARPTTRRARCSRRLQRLTTTQTVRRFWSGSEIKKRTTLEQCFCPGPSSQSELIRGTTFPTCVVRTPKVRTGKFPLCFPEFMAQRDAYRSASESGSSNHVQAWARLMRGWLLASARPAWGSGLPHHIHWTHHFVVLMLKDVAMPNVLVTLSGNDLGAPGQIKLHDQFGHRSGE